jgi:hypothetical protein
VSCAAGLGGLCSWSKKYTPLTFATSGEVASHTRVSAPFSGLRDAGLRIVIPKSISRPLLRLNSPHFAHPLPFYPKAQIRQGADRHSPLKVDATAVDNQRTQDNEKNNRGGYRPPIIFGAPWLGPPTVVVRSPAGFKVSIYHR